MSTDAPGFTDGGAAPDSTGRRAWDAGEFYPATEGATAAPGGPGASRPVQLDQDGAGSRTEALSATQGGPAEYRKKPVTVQAWRVTAGNGPAVARWCRGSWADGRGWAPPCAPAVSVPVLGDLVPALVGDWVLSVSGKGEFWTVPGSDFAATYEPVDPDADLYEAVAPKIAAHMDKLAANYPEDVFPAAGTGRDAIGGTAMRHAYRNAARAVRAGEATS